MSHSYTGGFHGWSPSADRKEMDGDYHPSDYDFNHIFTNSEILEMLKRNTLLRIDTIWKVDQMFLYGVELEGDSEGRNGFKHGKPHPFKTFMKYMNWNFCWEEIELGIIWAQAFGNSLCVGFKFDELDDEEAVGTIKVYQPMDTSTDTGFYIKDKHWDADGNVIFYTIAVYERDPKVQGLSLKEHDIPADRCVLISARRLAEQWGGTSQILNILPLARAEEITYASLAKRAFQLGSGMFVLEGIQSADLSLRLRQVIGNHPHEENILHLPTGVTPNWLYPKITGDIAKLMEVMNTEHCKILRISKEQYIGEKSNGGLFEDSKAGTLFTLQTINVLQTHYSRYVEEILNLLELDNTEFEWIQPQPEDVDEEEADPQEAAKKTDASVKEDPKK